MQRNGFPRLPGQDRANVLISDSGEQETAIRQAPTLTQPIQVPKERLEPLADAARRMMRGLRRTRRVSYA